MPTNPRVRVGPARPGPSRVTRPPVSLNPKLLFGGFVGLRIGGTDVTGFIRSRTPSVRSNANAQTGTLSFALQGSIGTIPTVTPEMDVNWNIGGFAYGGRVRSVTPSDIDRTDYSILTVECQDYTSLLDDDICDLQIPGPNPVRSVVETDAQRISWLLQSYGSDGISAYHVQTLVASLPAQDFTGQTLTQAIAAVLSFSNGSFYVDTAKDLHTFVTETNPAPFALSDNPDGVTSFGYKPESFSYPQDSVDLRNAYYLIPGRIAPLTTDTGATSTNNVTMSLAVSVMVTLRGAGLLPPTAVAVGAFLQGDQTSVTALYGQPTAAGNTVVACVTGPAQVTGAAATAAGWQLLFQFPGGPNGTTQWASIWAKFNCAAGETPPTWTNTGGGTTPMMAQLLEVAGVVSYEQAAYSTTPSGTTWTMTMTTPKTDALEGNFIVMATRRGTAGGTNTTVQFSESLTGADSLVHMGDSGASNQPRHSSFAYGILKRSAKPTWYTNEASIVTYGRREQSVTDTTIATQADLDNRGAALLSATSTPLRHASLVTYQPGLTPGMTVTVTNALFGISAQSFRIQGVDVSYATDDALPEFSVQFADQQIHLATQTLGLQAAQTSASDTAQATAQANYGALSLIVTSLQKASLYNGRWHASTLQALGAAWNKINIDTIDYDPHADFDLSNHRYIAPVKGLYHALFVLNLSAAVSGDIAYAINGGSQILLVNFAAGTAMTGHDFVYLNAGDTIEFDTFMGSAVNTVVTVANPTAMSIVYLGG